MPVRRLNELYFFIAEENYIADVTLRLGKTRCTSHDSHVIGTSLKEGWEPLSITLCKAEKPWDKVYLKEYGGIAVVYNTDCNRGLAEGIAREIEYSCREIRQLYGYEPKDS